METSSAVAAATNWLGIIGAVYAFFAFVLLAGSAGLRRAWDAPLAIRQSVTDYARRVMTFFAGILGAIGMLFNGLSQFTTVETGAGLAFAVLAIVPLLLVGLIYGDHLTEVHRRSAERTFANATASAGKSDKVVMPVLPPVIALADASKGDGNKVVAIRSAAAE
jgi:inner membrane protein involved in colicin E2 resistance